MGGNPREGSIPSSAICSQIFLLKFRMSYDAVVVGSGPNGLAAGITLAQSGKKVLLLEARNQIGGGMRSAELTLPGYVHDVCSAIHPLAMASPFFANLRLENFGLEWIEPSVPLVHPMLDGSSAVIERDLMQSILAFGEDGPRYQRLIEPFVQRADILLPQLLNPPWPIGNIRALTRFAMKGFSSAVSLLQRNFTSPAMRGMFAGMAAHSVRPLESPLTGAVGLLFCITAHASGWPLPRGGSHSIASAMRALFESLGGEVQIDTPIATFGDLPPCQAVLFDLAPSAVSRIAGEQLPPRYRKTLDQFRHGPGVFKIDWALDGAIPWTDENAAKAGTVHVGGDWEEIAESESAVWKGQIPERPFVLLAQQSLFDQTRAPEGKQTGWAYCHVPPRCDEDMTERIEAQIERFAPGFRDLILARHVFSPADFEAYNANYIGGDITGGVFDLKQFLARPALRRSPYTTPNEKIYICSASTPPGGGVHGMCGYHAARAALDRVLLD